jgi:hypothetical protein
MNGRFNNMWNEDPGRLDSIIGPRSKQCTGVPTYTTTHRNKNVNVVQTCIKMSHVGQRKSGLTKQVTS